MANKNPNEATRFQPGHTQAGRGHAAHERKRPWKEAIALVVNREKLHGRDILVEMAEACFEDAIKNRNVATAKELGDRLDGKPAQQLIHTGDEENPIAVKPVTGPEIESRIFEILGSAGIIATQREAGSDQGLPEVRDGEPADKDQSRLN